MPIPRSLFECFDEKGRIVVPLNQLWEPLNEALDQEPAFPAGLRLPDWVKKLYLALAEYDRGDRTEEEIRNLLGEPGEAAAG